MKPSLKHVFQYGKIWWRYFQLYKETLRPVEIDNIIKMLSCGSTIRGSAVYVCSNPKCSHTKRIAFTCKSRFCPSCGKKATDQWIEKQKAILPETNWQHITFTMPKEIWRLFALNRYLLNELSKIAAHIILSLTHKKKIIPGVFVALHTFGRDLKWNVHIHLSTTLGGITFDKTSWKPLFFKKDVLMGMWRYQIINLLRRSYQSGSLKLPKSLAEYCPTYSQFNAWLNRRYEKRWIIHCSKPTKTHYHNVAYLGRYVKRPPLAFSKLLYYDGENVIFRFLNHKNKKYKNFYCSSMQFIEHFIQHIPEKGFRLIRYYGFLANRNRKTLLDLVYKYLGQSAQASYYLRWTTLMKRTLGSDPLQCILCKNKLSLSFLQIGKNLNEIKKYHRELALMKLIPL